MTERPRSRRLRLIVLAVCVLVPAGVAAAFAATPAKVPAAGYAPTVGKASAASPTPYLARDVKTGSDKLGSLIPGGPDPIQDYIQPDTQIEPSIAANPANPKNAAAV